MDLGLKNKVAMVAAASSGLGRAVALGLAREGAKLAICSRDKSRIERAAEAIRAETHAEVLAMALDVGEQIDVERFTEKTLERFDQIDICVTNAGGPPSKTFAETTIDDWESAVRLNLASTVFFAHAVLPGMRARKWGRFITVTSVAVKQPIDGLILSNSVRAAVAGLVKSLANECGPDNVLVHNVCPGYTATDRLLSLAAKMAEREGVTREAVIDRWAQQTPLRRVCRPEEFADVVVFLASERASYLTGESLAIDGGMVRGTFG